MTQAFSSYTQCLASGCGDAATTSVRIRLPKQIDEVNVLSEKARDQEVALCEAHATILRFQLTHKVGLVSD